MFGKSVIEFLEKIRAQHEPESRSGVILVKCNPFSLDLNRISLGFHLIIIKTAA